MAPTAHASTPPPSSSLHTPTTPRFGFDDSYEPYSSRKSNRVSAQRARIARTPPQYSRSSKKSNSSPPFSPPTASKKQTPSTSPRMNGRRVSGALSADSAASAAAALGLPTPEPHRKMERKSATANVRVNALLPTPNKTPKKSPSKIAPGITSIARSLFRPETDEEAMPSPKKKGKRYKGFTMDSFEAEEGQPIQIHIDSNDRVPEVDMSSDNPFYGSSSVIPEPTKRASKRRRITVPGEGEQDVEKVERREDGLVYVFRGKKVFRKFTDKDGEESLGEDDAEDDELAQTVPVNLRRPLTRSSIKPRLLFPSDEQNKSKQKRSETTEDEEEAITDIEEPSTPMDFVDDHTTIPKLPTFAPATPPTTARATRSKKIDMDVSLGSDDEVPSPTRVDSGNEANLSPFDSWPRTKRQAAGSRKREGASMSRSVGRPSKKTRG